MRLGGGVDQSGEAWVPQTLSQYRVLQPVVLNDRKIELALPHKSLRLPFKVSLEKFDAPHDEGKPGSFSEFASTLSFQDAPVAGHPSIRRIDAVKLVEGSKYIQKLEEELGPARALDPEKRVYRGAVTRQDEKQITLEFEDRKVVKIPHSEIAHLEKNTHRIYMNNPTSYPETWYGPWLGTGFKFSQADHRMPSEPDYSGVQVLRDPGWMPKWVGSLMICFGIFTMFYLKPYFNRRPKVASRKPALQTSDLKNAVETAKPVGTSR